MSIDSYENTGRCCRSKRLVFATLLGVLAMAGVGCSSPVVIEDPGIDHPANPEAIAAPVSPVPDTLQVEAVTAPEQDENPHAHMHMSH